MKEIRSLQELSWWLAENPQPALVPTMGALHQGHLSLVEAAKESGQPILVSVFVNPTQFMPEEDFMAYPRDIEGDLAKLAATGADAVFLPEQKDIYPGDRAPNIPELPEAFGELEGEFRPNHFVGVAQVMFRFFQLIRPQVAYFGQKDFQQTVLMKWLTRTCKFDTEIAICPTVREANGLAMSSRNVYLSLSERERASLLYRALQKGQRSFSIGERDAKNILRGVRELLEAEPALTAIDYVDIRGAEFFEKVLWVAKPSVLVAAIRIGKTRLLDNVIIG